MARSPTRKRQSTQSPDLDFVFLTRREMRARVFGTKKEQILAVLASEFLSQLLKGRAVTVTCIPGKLR